jgi:hypothetical protein
VATPVFFASFFWNAFTRASQRLPSTFEHPFHAKLLGGFGQLQSTCEVDLCLRVIAFFQGVLAKEHGVVGFDPRPDGVFLGIRRVLAFYRRLVELQLGVERLVGRGPDAIGFAFGLSDREPIAVHELVVRHRCGGGSLV